MTGKVIGEVAPVVGGVEVGWIAFPLLCCDSRRAAWRQYPRPDPTVGVLTTPVKWSGRSARLVCTQCGLANGYPLIRASGEGVASYLPTPLI